MSNKNYNCTQAELYAVCALGWESFGQNIEKFSSMKPKYTDAFLAERKAELEQVMLMHNHFQRSSVHESMRIELKQMAEKGLGMWKVLQSHIREAFPGENRKAKMRGAGQDFFDAAYAFKWEACQNLLLSGNTFIREHSVDLLAKNNMDPAFPEAFAAQLQAFNTLYLKYLDTVKQGELNTRSKTEANNKLYNELRSMFADARILFKGNDAMLKLFSFSAMLNQISGPGTAGLKGFIAGLPEPVDVHPGLELKLLESGKTAQIGEDGAYRFSQVAAGNYTLQVKADGFQTLSLPVTVNTGSFTLLNVAMEPEARV